MIYNISNKENEIKELLLQLRDTYGDYAFISYIHGEYGTRVWVYNSIVYNFYNLMKSQNKTCIALVFKGTKCFLDNLCDHIIEIDDIEFASTILNKIEDNSLTSLNHVNDVVPSNSYYGNDGWNLTYIRGIHSPIYEDILLEMNFSNIFYTLHLDGSRYINLHGCNNGYLYKANNQNVVFPNINNSICINLINNLFDETANTENKTNKIVIRIRNTNKWPNRNIQIDYCNAVFDYCIANNKICYVFQDIIAIDLPIHDNIIECNDRFKNRPNFDNFVNICSECDIYIGADSGPTYLLMHQQFNCLKICNNNLEYKTNNAISHIDNNSLLLNILNNFYA
jgi:hypothetical protein